uniref:SAM domain-containing protein n=1 Tax=Cairina moschata TaxID=8855 RepID=A0A8C3BSK2_CAIMO
MEPVGAWGPAKVAAWLRGLDAAVQGYPFEAWGLAGTELLGLSAGVLEALGVRRVGHQELLLDAVEQLRALVSPGTSLRTLTEGLRDLALRTQTLVLEGPPGGGGTHGYLFSTLNDFSASRDIILLCARLAEVLQEGAANGWGVLVVLPPPPPPIPVFSPAVPAHRGHLREHRGLQPPGSAGPQSCAGARGAGAPPRAMGQPPRIPQHPNTAP